MLTEACCTQGSRASREDPNVKTFLHRACVLIGVWGMVHFVLQVCSLCMCSHVGWLPCVVVVCRTRQGLNGTRA